MPRRCSSGCGAMLALAVVAGPAAAQALDGGADTVLARRVSLEVRNASLGDALARLRHEQGVPLAFSGDVLPTERRVTLAIRNETLQAALEALLAGSGLEVVVTRRGTIVVVRRDAVTGAGPVAPMLDTMVEVERAALATGVRQLDEIVVTGTAVAGAPEREQPTGVSVVSGSGLAKAAHSRVSDLIRTLLPGVVLWDRGPSGPPAQVTSVRGVSSFTTRTLKTYVDGVELASPDLFTLLDGRSIERIEVIRGPQGAALYGPDALNGILQLETRKGRLGASPVRARGAVSGGPFERADQPDAVLWQEHALGITGGGGRASFDVGGSFGNAGSRGGVPWLRTWTTSGGARLLVGPVVVTGSARIGRYEYGLERPVTDGGTVETSLPQELEERGAGITAVHSITDRWRHTLVAGHHWISGAREPSRPGLLVPRLPLGATHETAWRTSFRYSSAWDLPLGEQEATLTAGAEHSNRHVERSILRSVTTRDLSLLYDDDLRSTGGFGQARFRLGSHLVLSGGTRAEWSSSVGDKEGAAWASTAGATWTHSVGRATLRLRGAWGRGLRPPEPGMSRAMATATVRQLPNSELASETQSGIEVGTEVYAGAAAYARATWYDQRATDLIQQVLLPSDGTIRNYQFQNVGGITNRGVELEAGAGWNRVTLSGFLYFTRSEVRRLARNYTGELKPGDELPEVPEHVGAVALQYAAGRVRATVGASWLGSWTGFDWVALRATELGQEPRRATLRDYWIDYPAVFRPYFAAEIGLGGAWAAFLRVDNPGKTASYLRDNLTPPLGRSTQLGLELRP